MTALWTEAELARALGAPSAPLAVPVGGVSIDTRTLAPGDLFFAIKGEASDGHDYVARAFEAGAAAAVDRPAARRRPRRARADLRRRRHAAGDGAAGARRARARQGARGRRHRLGRQDQRQGDAEGRARSLRADPCFRGLLQQSLGRAAVAFAPAGERRLRGDRDRHEPRRRDHAARRDGAAACRAGDDDRAGAHRASRLARRNRRRQGRDLLRARARRRRRAQSRRAAVRAARRRGAGRAPRGS